MHRLRHRLQGLTLIVAGTVSACDATEATLIEFPTGGADASQPQNVAHWSPAPGSSYQIQLTGELDSRIDADVFIVDFESTSSEELEALHSAGQRAVCYFSAGSYEPWRDDAAEFPEEALGEPLADYPQERWVDPRNEAVQSAMVGRVEFARNKGCDAIEPSLVAPIPAESGFALSQADQAEYAELLREAAHTRGLGILFAGGDDFAARLAGSYDAALTIGCLERDSCSTYQAFSNLEKSVLMIEIGDEQDQDRVCSAAAALGFAGLIKPANFGAFRVPCP